MATLKGLFAKYKDRLDDFQEEFKDEILESVKEKTPEDTGDLKRGWRGKVLPNNIEIGNVEEYASFVEYGVEPHTRTTAWGKKTKPYTHPGQQPAGMLRRTMLEAEQIADRVVKRLDSKGGDYVKVGDDKVGLGK